MKRIVKAAVKILDLRQNKEIIIPCHRHCDAFYILKQFSYQKDIDYKEIAQGFLDQDDNFYDRIESFKIAWNALQLKYEHYSKGFHVTELFSEDLW